MERNGNNGIPRAQLRKSCALILSGVDAVDGLCEQQLFLESMIYQCALLTRITGGEERYRLMLERLKRMSLSDLERITAPGATRQDSVSDCTS